MPHTHPPFSNNPLVKRRSGGFIIIWAALFARVYLFLLCAQEAHCSHGDLSCVLWCPYCPLFYVFDTLRLTGTQERKGAILVLTSGQLKLRITGERPAAAEPRQGLGVCTMEIKTEGWGGTMKKEDKSPSPSLSL